MREILRMSCGGGVREEAGVAIYFLFVMAGLRPGHDELGMGLAELALESVQDRVRDAQKKLEAARSQSAASNFFRSVSTAFHCRRILADRWRDNTTEPDWA